MLFGLIIVFFGIVPVIIGLIKGKYAVLKFLSEFFYFGLLGVPFYMLGFSAIITDLRVNFMLRILSAVGWYMAVIGITLIFIYTIVGKDSIRKFVKGNILIILFGIIVNISVINAIHIFLVN